MTTWKKVFWDFWKCFKNKKTRNHMYMPKLSSGASCFHWSSLRCFYSLIGVHLWYIQLIGHDLERHTPVYIRSHSWQCMSEHKPSMKSKELSVDRRDRIVLRNKSGKGKNSAALKVPLSTVASIICKWKKFRTTRTLSRAGRPSKLSDWGRRALVRERQRSSVERGEPSRRTTICSNPPIRPVW